MTLNRPNDLNDTVRAHETEIEWRHREMAVVCYCFFDVFNAAFFEGQLPTCFLQFEWTRRTRLGHYRPGRNAVAAKHEINFE